MHTMFFNYMECFLHNTVTAQKILENVGNVNNFKLKHAIFEIQYLWFFSGKKSLNSILRIVVQCHGYQIIFKLKIVILFHTVEFLFVASQMLTTNRFEKALYTQEAQWPWVSRNIFIYNSLQPGYVCLRKSFTRIPLSTIQPKTLNSPKNFQNFLHTGFSEISILLYIAHLCMISQLFRPLPAISL